MIPNTKPGGYPLSRRGRALLTLWSFCLLGGFGLAVTMEPDPRGYGTHQRLGLPPCSFRVMFNLPCPSCGMTTSFSNFIRGRFVEAARANVAGLLLATVCAVGVPWCWLSVSSGRMWNVSQPGLCLIWLLVVLCVVAISQWAYRIFML